MTTAGRPNRGTSRPAIAITASLAVLASWLCGPGASRAQAADSANAAPITAYMMSPADEIVMARSAAPPSLAKDAEVMVLGKSGYEVADKGDNGFVCLVQRSWANEPSNAQFWNPMVRGPLCYNPAAVRSVMPTYLERTKWVLAGASKDDIIKRTETAVAEGQIGPPEAGAMSLMLSKMGCIGDNAKGPWLPHVMVFVPRDKAYPSDWGANLPGSPIIGTPDRPALDPAALYFIPVSKWSDGTPSPRTN
jgi:hypothetical protein